MARPRRTREGRPARRTSTRYKVGVASLIAVTSLIGAVAAWRAEAASRQSDEAEQTGFANSVANAQAKAQIRSSLEQVLVQYESSRTYAAQAVALRKQAASLGAADAARLRVQSSAAAHLAAFLKAHVRPNALRPDGTLDLDRAFQLDYAQARQNADLDPAPDFRQVDHFAKKSERLVGLTALLIAAAFFFTLAQVGKRRLAARVYLGGGVIVLVAATVLLVVVEVAT